MPLSGGPSLILASGPISWHGEHNRLNTCSPATASCPTVGPAEAAKSHSSKHPYLQHFFSLNAIDVAPLSLLSDNKRIGLLNAQVQSSRSRLRNSADELARPIGRTAI